MTDAPSVTLAFLAGVVSFLSPCCLPLVPGYLAAVTRDPSGGTGRSRADVLARSALFTLTFSTIFIALGLTATTLGSFLFDNQPTLNKVGGVVIVVLGLLSIGMVGVVRLNRSWHVDALLARAGSGSPVAAGAAFAVAWTPCIGPTLGATLTLAATTVGTPQATVLLAAYSAGLALPFLATSMSAHRLGERFGWFRRHAAGMQLAAGVTMVTMGVLVFTGELFRLNIAAQQALDRVGLNFWQSL